MHVRGRADLFLAATVSATLATGLAHALRRMAEKVEIRFCNKKRAQLEARSCLDRPVDARSCVYGWDSLR